jgi:hypothetical protein
MKAVRVCIVIVDLRTTFIGTPRNIVDADDDLDDE